MRTIDGANLEEQIARLQEDIDCYQNPSEVVDVLDYVLQLIDEAPTIEPYGTWIPCSERLPKCNGRYLVWRPHYYGGDRGEATVCYFDGQNTWHDADGVDFKRILSTSDITAWMPLPEPYREENK